MSRGCSRGRSSPSPAPPALPPPAGPGSLPAAPRAAVPSPAPPAPPSLPAGDAAEPLRAVPSPSGPCRAPPGRAEPPRPCRAPGGARRDSPVAEPRSLRRAAVPPRISSPGPSRSLRPGPMSSRRGGKRSLPAGGKRRGPGISACPRPAGRHLPPARRDSAGTGQHRGGVTRGQGRTPRDVPPGVRGHAAVASQMLSLPRCPSWGQD